MAFGKTFGINFPEKYRTYLQEAVENEHISWIGSSYSHFAGDTRAEFKWAGCTWSLHEYFELVESIYLIDGDLSEEAIVVEKLKKW